MFIKLPMDITVVALLGPAYSSNNIEDYFVLGSGVILKVPTISIPFEDNILNIYHHKYLKFDVS